MPAPGAAAAALFQSAQPLAFEELASIATGVAEGLRFLHQANGTWVIDRPTLVASRSILVFERCAPKARGLCARMAATCDEFCPIYISSVAHAPICGLHLWIHPMYGQRLQVITVSHSQQASFSLAAKS